MGGGSSIPFLKKSFQVIKVIYHLTKFIEDCQYA